MRMLVCLMTLAACGGGDDSGGGGGGNVDAAATPANSGFISISGYNAVANSTPISGGSVSASFTIQSTSSSCTQHTVGSCDVYTCPTTTPPSPAYASAGTVTVTGLTQAVTLTPMTDKTYFPFSSQQTLYSGGETLALSASGADAPAFSVTLVAPSRPQITSPAKPASGGSLTINRAQDFSASWTGGGTGKVYLYVSGPTGSGTTIACGFDASAGTGKVPTAALAMLPAGMGSFSASALAVKTVDQGAWRYYGQAFYTGVWSSDMSLVASTATLQ